MAPDRINTSPATDGSTGSIGSILIVADLHGHAPHLDWVKQHGPRFDLVALPGDFDDASLRLPGAAREAITSGFLGDLADRVRVAACSGNHDLDATDGDGERFADWTRNIAPNVCSDGDLLLTPDVAISSCPWWDGPNGQRRLREQLAGQVHLVGDRKWLWLHHAPPAGTVTAWDGSTDRGDDVLTELIDEFQPWMVATGHIHDAPFTRQGGWIDRVGPTWVINPGRQAGMLPSCVEVDTRADSATWSGDLAGARRTECVTLGGVDVGRAA
ncbi:MAG: metallophosphoesterase [Actinomycetota bacterium]